MKWERLAVQEGPDLLRAKVPGGWLILVEYDVEHRTEHRGMVSGYDWRPAITFVPDPSHDWQH